MKGKNNPPSSTKDRWSAFGWVRLHSCCKTGRSQQELTGGSTTHLQPETNLVLNTSKHGLEGVLCVKGRRKIKPKTQVRVQGLPIWQLTLIKMELGILSKALHLKHIIISFPTLICTSRSQHETLSRPKLPSFLIKIANLPRNLSLGACPCTRMYWASRKWGFVPVQLMPGKIVSLQQS